MSLKPKYKKKKIVLPSFIIGGAAKSGTTTISRLLNAHPAIYIPVQEMNYYIFAGEGDKFVKTHNTMPDNFESYASFYRFSLNEDTLITGEKSTGYLYKAWRQKVIQNILKLHPDAEGLKLIFILRQPVERMFSQYLYNLSFDEELSFEQAVGAWEHRRKLNWIPAYDYIGGSLYADALKDYIDSFQQIRIYLFEDLKEKPACLLRDMYRFLNVEDDFVPRRPDRAENVSGIPGKDFAGKTYHYLNKAGYLAPFKKMIPDSLMRQKIKSWFMDKPSLETKTKHAFGDCFRQDIMKLQDLLNRDLSHWLND